MGCTAWARRIVVALVSDSLVLVLACLDQILDRPRHVLDWHIRIGAVEKVDMAGLEAFERAIDGPADMLGDESSITMHTQVSYRGM
ncbi:hypothetical protein ABH906_005423 [Pseudomonas frederiksbergensis]